MKELLEAKHPALLCSFGKDSIALLKTVLAIRPETQILYFYDRPDPFAAKIIKEWNLEVGSYAPTIRYRVEDTVISEYAIGNARLPLLQDISESGKPVGTTITPQFAFEYDITIWGYKRSDRHPLVQKELEADFQLGPTRMIAPLYEWSDADVMESIKDIDYQPINEDVLPCELPSLPKDVFQARFGLSSMRK